MLPFTSTAFGQLYAGNTRDANIQVQWHFEQNEEGELTGSGKYEIINISPKTIRQFDLHIAGLLKFNRPVGWNYTYDLNTGMLILFGQRDKLQSGERMNVQFTYNPNNKELGTGRIIYSGDETFGSFNNFPELKNINVAPAPI
jgi:hypothetical protein